MLLSSLYTRVLWPWAAPVAYGRDYSHRLARLRREERQSPDEIRERQLRALQRILRHAYDTSSFYRQRFEAAGVRPEDLRSEADLPRLPILSRQDLRQNLRHICSSAFRFEDLQESFTGGTTDAPVSLRRDFPAVRTKVAIQDAFWQWSSYRPGDKVFWIWGARTDFPQNPSWKWRIRQKYFMRHEFAPTSWLDAATMETMRQNWNRMRPRIVAAFPGPLRQFCHYLRESGLPIHSPRGVIYTAEALTQPDRERIQATLGAPLFEHYGSRDFGIIAGECEAHQGLHLNPSSVVVEYLPVGSGPNPVYELIVTDLNNYGMPLIRYKINDCVLSMPSTDACPCGRQYPRLPAIAGRTVEVFRLPNGAMVPGITLDRVVKAAPGLVKTQFVQESLAQFRLRYVAGPDFDASQLQKLRQTLDNFFPPGVQFEFEPVADIEREASGKTRFCISKLTAEERGF